jgi:hypothetical protein
MMTENEKQILETLQELDAAVKSLRTSPTSDPSHPAVPAGKPDLNRYFSRLDELAASLTPDCDPNLRHYLARKSYEKARLFLEGQSAGSLKGTCGKKA